MIALVVILIASFIIGVVMCVFKAERNRRPVTNVTNQRNHVCTDRSNNTEICIVPTPNQLRNMYDNRPITVAATEASRSSLPSYGATIMDEQPIQMRNINRINTVAVTETSRGSLPSYGAIITNEQPLQINRTNGVAVNETTRGPLPSYGASIMDIPPSYEQALHFDNNVR